MSSVRSSNAGSPRGANSSPQYDPANRYRGGVSSVSLPGAGLLGEDVMVATPDGRRLRAMVDGPDVDTLVVLEAGLGASPLYWQPVQRLLRTDFRVVAYERAGIGGSDPSSRHRSLEALAADLLCVIDAFPHRRVVLAGHSWGGPIIRVAAARRLAAGRGDVAGLVLADQSDEHDRLFFTSGVRRQFALTAAVISGLARAGLAAPLRRLLTSGRSTPLRRGMVEALCTPQTAHAFAAEMRPVVDELRWLRDHPLDLGALPVRVLSGLAKPRFGKRTRAELIVGHRATATTYAGAVFVPVHGSGHQIPTTEPVFVAEHLRELAS